MTTSRQLSDAFQTLITAARAKEQARFQALLAVPIDMEAVVRRQPATPEALAQEFKPLRDEIAEAVNRIVTPKIEGADVSGTLGEYQVLMAQGDFADRIRRARSIRESSYARRAVHAAARRNAHSMDGGYLERRVVGRMVNKLKAGQQL